jgi:hypothetical protein
MNAVVAGTAGLASMLVLAGPGAWAQSAEPDEQQQPAIALSAAALPRFDALEGATGSPRLALNLLPPRRSALGLSAVLNSPADPAPGSPRPGFGNATASSFDLGVMWRHTTGNDRQIDVTAWRRMTPAPDAITQIQQQQQPTYGARIEMQLKPARVPGLAAEAGFLGIQMQGGGRLMLRKKDGRPTVVYRVKF